MSSVTIDIPQPPSNFKSSVDIHGQHAKGTAVCEFILFNKTTCLSRAQLIWFGGKESFTYPITKELIMTGKLSFDKVKQKFSAPIFDSLPAFSGIQTVQSGQFLFSYCEIRGVGEQRIEIHKTAEYLFIKDWVGVVHISDKLKIYTIPTSPLSHELGITNENYPRLLHGLFVTRVPPKIAAKHHISDPVTIAPTSHPEIRSVEGETKASSSSSTAEVSRKKRKVSFAPSPISSEDSLSQANSPSKDSSPNRRSARLSRLKDNSEELVASKASLKAIAEKSLVSSETAKRLREVLDTRVTRSKVAAASASQEANSDDDSVSSTVSSVTSNSSISAGISFLKRKPGRPPGTKNKKKKDSESYLAAQTVPSLTAAEMEASENRAEIAMDFLSKHPVEPPSGRKRRRRKPVEVKEGKAQDCNIVLYESLESACHVLTRVEVESHSPAVKTVTKEEGIDGEDNKERKVENGHGSSSKDGTSTVVSEFLQNMDLKPERETFGEVEVDIECPSSDFICEDNLLVQQILIDDGPEIEVEEISQGTEMGLDQFLVIEGKAGQYTAPPKKMSLADYKRRRSTVEETPRSSAKQTVKSGSTVAKEQVPERNESISQEESLRSSVPQDSSHKETTELGQLDILKRQKKEIPDSSTTDSVIIRQDIDDIREKKMPSAEVSGLSSEDVAISSESNQISGNSRTSIKLTSLSKPLSTPVKSSVSPRKAEIHAPYKKSKLVDAVSQPSDVEGVVKTRAEGFLSESNAGVSVPTSEPMEKESVTSTEQQVPVKQLESLADTLTKTPGSVVEMTPSSSLRSSQLVHKLPPVELNVNSAAAADVFVRASDQQAEVSDAPANKERDQTERLGEIKDSPVVCTPDLRGATEVVSVKDDRINPEAPLETDRTHTQELSDKRNTSIPSKDVAIGCQTTLDDNAVPESKNLGKTSFTVEQVSSDPAEVNKFLEDKTETPGVAASADTVAPTGVSTDAPVATSFVPMAEMAMPDPVIPSSGFSIPIRQRLPVPIPPHVLNVPPPPPYFPNPVNRWVMPPPPPPPIPVPPGVFRPSEPPPGPGVFNGPNPLRPPMPGPMPAQWNNFGGIFPNLPVSTQQHFFDSVADIHRPVQTPEHSASSAADSPGRSPASQRFRPSRSRSRSQSRSQRSLSRSRSRSRSSSSRSSSRSSGRSTQSDRPWDHHEIVQKTELLTKIYQDLTAMGSTVLDIPKQDVGVQFSPSTRNFKCQHGSSFKKVTRTTQTPRRSKLCDVAVQAVSAPQVCNKGMQMDGPRKRNSSSMTVQVKTIENSSQTSDVEGIDSERKIDDFMGLREHRRWRHVHSIVHNFFDSIEDKDESDGGDEATSEHSDDGGGSGNDEGVMDDNTKEDLVPSPVISGASNISEGDLSDITPAGSESGTPPPTQAQTNVASVRKTCDDGEKSGQITSGLTVCAESEMEASQGRMLRRHSLPAIFAQPKASPISKLSLPLPPVPPPPPPVPPQLAKLWANQNRRQNSPKRSIEGCFPVGQKATEGVKCGDSVAALAPNISLHSHASATRLSSVKKNIFPSKNSKSATLLENGDTDKEVDETPELSKHAFDYSEKSVDYIPLVSENKPCSCNDSFCKSDEHLLISALSAGVVETDKMLKDSGKEPCKVPDQENVATSSHGSHEELIESRTDCTEKSLPCIQNGSTSHCFSPQKTKQAFRQREKSSVSPTRSDKVHSRSRPRSRSKSKKRRQRDWSYSRRRVNYSRSHSRERSRSRRRYYKRGRSSSNESCTSMRSWQLKGNVIPRNRFRSESPVYKFTTKTKPAIDIVLSKSSKKFGCASKSKQLTSGPVVKKPALTAAELLAKKREKESLSLSGKISKEDGNKKLLSEANSPLDIGQMMENFKIHMAKRSSKSPTPTFPDSYLQYTAHCPYQCIVPTVSDPLLVQSSDVASMYATSSLPLPVVSPMSTQAPPHSFTVACQCEAAPEPLGTQHADSFQTLTSSSQPKALDAKMSEMTSDDTAGDAPVADPLTQLDTVERNSRCSIGSGEACESKETGDDLMKEISEEPSSEDGQLCDTTKQDEEISETNMSEARSGDTIMSEDKAMVNNDAWSHTDVSQKTERYAKSENDSSRKTFKIKLVRCSTVLSSRKKDSTDKGNPGENVETIDSQLNPAIEQADELEPKLPVELPQSPIMEVDDVSGKSHSTLQMADKHSTLFQGSFGSELPSPSELQPLSQQLDVKEGHLQEEPDDKLLLQNNSPMLSSAKINEELVERETVSSSGPDLVLDSEVSSNEMESKPNNSSSDGCKLLASTHDIEIVAGVETESVQVKGSNDDFTEQLLEDDSMKTTTTVTPVNENFVVDASSTIHEISSDSNSYDQRSSCMIVDAVSDLDSGSRLFPFSNSPFTSKPSVSVKAPVARKKSLEDVLRRLSVDQIPSPKKLLLSGIQSSIKANFIRSQSASPTKGETPAIDYTCLDSPHQQKAHKRHRLEQKSLIISIPIEIQDHAICVVSSVKKLCLRPRHKSKTAHSSDDCITLIVSFPLDKIDVSDLPDQPCSSISVHNAVSNAPIITSSTRYHIIECKESLDVCESPPSEKFVKSSPFQPSLRLGQKPVGSSYELQRLFNAIPNAVTARVPTSEVSQSRGIKSGDNSSYNSVSENDPRTKFSFHWSARFKQLSTDIPGSRNQEDAPYDEICEPLSPSSIINTAKAYLSECYESPDSNNTKNISQVKPVSRHQLMLPCSSPDKSPQKRSPRALSHNRQYSPLDSGIGTGESCSPEDGAKNPTSFDITHHNDEIKKPLFVEKSTTVSLVGGRKSPCAKSPNSAPTIAKSLNYASVKDKPVSPSKSQGGMTTKCQPQLSNTSKSTFSEIPAGDHNKNINKPVVESNKPDHAVKECHHNSSTKSPEKHCVVPKPSISTTENVVSTSAMKLSSGTSLKKSSLVVEPPVVAVKHGTPSNSSNNPSASIKSPSVIPERPSVLSISATSDAALFDGSITNNKTHSISPVKHAPVENIPPIRDQDKKDARSTLTMPQDPSISAVSAASTSTVSNHAVKNLDKINSKKVLSSVTHISDAIDDKDSKISSKPSISPKKPATISKLPTTVPKQPATIPKQPATIPKQPATIPKQPATIPKQPATIPKQPATIPKQPATIPKRPSPSSNSAAKPVATTFTVPATTDSPAKIVIVKNRTSAVKNTSNDSSTKSPDVSGMVSKEPLQSSGCDTAVNDADKVVLAQETPAAVGQAGSADGVSSPSSSDESKDATKPHDTDSDNKLPTKALMGSTDNNTQQPKASEQLPFESAKPSLTKPWVWEKTSNSSKVYGTSQGNQAKSESGSLGDASAGAASTKSFTSKQSEVASPEVKTASWKSNSHNPYKTSPTRPFNWQGNSTHRDRRVGYVNYHSRYSASPYISPPHHHYQNPYNRRKPAVDYNHGSSNSGNYSSQQYPPSAGPSSNIPLLMSPPRYTIPPYPHWFPRQ